MIEQHIDYKLIGARIRAARKELNITQQELSDACKLSLNHISHIETGASALSLPALLSICRALNCTADRLLYDSLPVINQMCLNTEIAKCFEDADREETSVMLAVAHAAKDTMKMRTRLQAK